MEEAIRRFSISLTKISTGESSKVVVQAPFKIAKGSELLEMLFDNYEYIVVEVIEIKSIVKISIEPICLN